MRPAAAIKHFRVHRVARPNQCLHSYTQVWAEQLSAGRCLVQASGSGLSGWCSVTSGTGVNTPSYQRRYVYDHSGRKYGGKLPMVGFMTEWVRSKGHGFKSQVRRICVPP